MQNSPHQPDWYLEHLDHLTARFAETLDAAELVAAVPACGPWTVADLAAHLGGVHQWAAFCIESGRAPTPDDEPPVPFDRADPAGWYRAAALRVGDALRQVDPDGPTWHPFPAPKVARLWHRRQAHEAAVHLWDLEQAVSTPSQIDPVLAADGIDEFFEIVIPRVMAREGIATPRSSFHVHCTDVEGEWLVGPDDTGDYHLVRAHQKGDAALRGPAQLILLALWGRAHGRDDELSPVGDPQVLADWLAVGGM